MNPLLDGLSNFLMMVASQSSEVNLWTWTNTFSVHNNSLASKKSEDILNVSWNLIFPSFFPRYFCLNIYIYKEGIWSEGLHDHNLLWLARNVVL